MDDLEITLNGEAEILNKPLEGAKSASEAHTNNLDLTAPEDRYSRFRLIPWWDQDLLKASKILVVGAGALGNEILKNLALLGIGHITVADMDSIENTNLSRSVLYREKDEGRKKAEVAAERVMDINPHIEATPFIGNVIYDLGIGAFLDHDLVICGLDNREARLWINRCCYRVSKPMIDGAIEVLNGTVKVFVPPYTACYECTMNKVDFDMMAKRKSCSLLTRDQMLEGKIPTTPTTSSVVAGIECQEAVKLLHNREDLPTLAGKGFFFNGLTHDSFVTLFPKKEDCMSHETYKEITETDFDTNTTLREVLERAKADLGDGASLNFPRDFVTKFECKCGNSKPVFKQFGRLKESDARCECGEIADPVLCHCIDENSEFLDMTLGEFDIPKRDIIPAISLDMNEKFYLMK